MALAAFVAWAMTGQASAMVGTLPTVEDGGGAGAPAIVRVEADRGLLDRGLACTGTLIAAAWVLTAQHCTNVNSDQRHPYRPGEITVGAGWPVAAVHRMGGYDARSLVNDIALLELAAPVTTVVPARLAARPLGTASEATVYGSAHTADVRVTSLAAVNHGPCLFPDPPRGSMTFVTSVHGGSQRGDSGGPLLRWEDGVPLLQSVTAGAADRVTCGAPDLVGRPQAWVGISNRVDRASAAWPFLAAYVPGL